MRLKAVIAYDGSAYNGYQKQINGKSIQTELEKALNIIHKKPTPVTASGRTDAKVHALGQVIHFEGNPAMPMKAYYEAMNTILPKDIRVLSVEPVADDFHARFSAKQKHYEYVFTTDIDSPFNERYKARLRKMPDIEKMREGAQVFLGTHDFTSFCHAKVEEEKSKVKTITTLDIVQEGKDLRLIYKGDGFLRYQVRMMTGALLALGQGRITVEDLQNMLDARDKEACRFNAPAQGLYLVNVKYD